MNEEPWRGVPVGDIGSMQQFLLNTPNVFSVWFNYYVESMAALNYVQLPNAEGLNSWPNQSSISSAIENYQGSPDDYFLMLCACLLLLLFMPVC